MRKIKFRCWNDRLAKMCDDWNWNDDTGVLTPYNDHCVLMQFTGLTDKNGEEVWEGDIIKETHEDPEKEGKKTFSWPIVWLEKCGAFGDADDETHLCDIGMENKEVIGNVWENPELLKDN